MGYHITRQRQTAKGPHRSENINSCIFYKKAVWQNFALELHVQYNAFTRQFSLLHTDFRIWMVFDKFLNPIQA